MNRCHTATLLIAAALTASSCNNADTSSMKNTADTVIAKTDTAIHNMEQSVESAAREAKSKLSGNVDSNFVVKAATTNAGELRILQKGLDKGTDKDLKGHARMMLADHKKMGEKVKAYCAKKGYVLPDGDNGKADDELSKLDGKAKGSDFDKEWADHMVSAHKDCIDMFEKAQTDVKDQDLKNIITGALPTLRSHLDMMTQLQGKLGK